MIGSNWKIYIGLFLIALSAILSLAHYLVFRDAHTLFFYLALDVVFVPVQVLLVTLIIEQLLTQREQRAILNKMNMVIGAFYSEVGNDLLEYFRKLSLDRPQLENQFKITKEWKAEHYKTSLKFSSDYKSSFEFNSLELETLKELLRTQKYFILALLQNPNLLEHDRFTDLLWAVLHLTEELDVRKSLDDLPPADIEHLKGDMDRAFGQLISQWLEYMKHLRTEYPYLYSLAIRTNPFNPDASAVIY